MVTYSRRPIQELDQADISVIRKVALRDRLGAIRKAFDKEVKDAENAASKEVRLA